MSVSWLFWNSLCCLSRTQTHADTVIPINIFRILKYLLKIYCIILIIKILYDTDFRFSRLFFGQVSNTAICLKKCHKNEWHLRFITHIYTKLSQNLCLIINTHNFDISICHMWLQVMERPLILLRFFWIFSYIIIDDCLMCCISTKLS